MNIQSHYSLRDQKARWGMLHEFPRRAKLGLPKPMRQAYMINLPSWVSGVIESIRRKHLNDLRLAISHNLPKTLTPFDRLVQRLRLIVVQGDENSTSCPGI